MARVSSTWRWRGRPLGELTAFCQGESGPYRTQAIHPVDWGDIQQPASEIHEHQAGHTAAQVVDQGQAFCGARHAAKEKNGLVIAQVVQEERTGHYIVPVREVLCQRVPGEKSHRGLLAGRLLLGVSHRPRISITAFDVEMQSLPRARCHRAMGISPAPVAMSRTLNRFVPASRARARMDGQSTRYERLQKLMRFKPSSVDGEAGCPGRPGPEFPAHNGDASASALEYGLR